MVVLSLPVQSPELRVASLPNVRAEEEAAHPVTRVVLGEATAVEHRVADAQHKRLLRAGKS
jgi:hypothetical protein